MLRADLVILTLMIMMAMLLKLAMTDTMATLTMN